jgi:predicted permease
MPDAASLAPVASLAARLGAIFYFIVLPLLLLIGLGYGLQRALGLEMRTLVRLNFYMITPAMIYVSMVGSALNAADIATVFGFQALQMPALALLALGAARLRGVPRDQRSAMVMATMFYNSGNYGLPLQELAFRGQGQGGPAMALQVFVMISQNIVNFTVGVLLASAGRRDRTPREKLTHIAQFSPLYALAAALGTMALRAWLGELADGLVEALDPFWQALARVRDAFVAVALATLGAQLAVMRRDPGGAGPVTLSVLLRLLAGPALGLGLIGLLGLEGFVAQVLLISTATPTAVNAMLMCLEFENHPDDLARVVRYATFLSPVMVTLVVFLAQSGAI